MTRYIVPKKSHHQHQQPRPELSQRSDEHLVDRVRWYVSARNKPAWSRRRRLVISDGYARQPGCTRQPRPPIHSVTRANHHQTCTPCRLIPANDHRKKKSSLPPRDIPSLPAYHSLAVSYRVKSPELEHGKNRSTQNPHRTPGPRSRLHASTKSP